MWKIMLSEMNTSTTVRERNDKSERNTSSYVYEPLTEPKVDTWIITNCVAG
jgi:hypothetical protein